MWNTKYESCVRDSPGLSNVKRPESGGEVSSQQRNQPGGLRTMTNHDDRESAAISITHQAIINSSYQRPTPTAV